jgi:preprotein translocase subunit SecA
MATTTTAVGRFMTRIFGSRNDRLLKRYRRMVAEINGMEPKVMALTDEQLRDRTQELRTGLVAGKLRSADVMAEAFAIVREGMDRHIGMRQIFNPDENFDPDKFDDETLALYDGVQRRMINEGLHWLAVPIPLPIYAAVRKLYPDSRPPFRARCFDVQMIGGLVLYEGKIAEMATGEGKTFVGPLATFMRVLEGFHCHVITVNDYLVKRDASWIQPAYANLGLTVGWLQQPMEPGGDERRRQYAADVTYGTNSEFGFDYLRDNMKKRVDEQVQGPLDFAIVDEVDSVLIDEARTPLIISGPARDDAGKFKEADAVARAVILKNKPWDAAEAKCDAAKRAIKSAEGDLDHATTKADKEAARQRRADAEKALAAAEAEKEGLTQYYEVELDRKSVHLTHEGIAAAQEVAGVGSFYVGENMEWPHLMEQALRAHVVYERDKDYVVERGLRGEIEVIIVDEFTGRKMAGRQWSDGLHQAAEAKENVKIKEESQTLATITLQNFFKLYRALSGMTGTALTEAEEFHKIYRLDVVSIPTNRPVIRQDNEDRVYRTEKEKWTNILDEIKAVSELGRPVLVGTTSVEKSEMLSAMLKRKYGIEHEVLNAKNHEREAQIVALAGQQHVNPHGELVGNVTIATNMAGRGTDIKPLPGTFYDVITTPDPKQDGGTFVIEQRTTGKRVEVPAATAQQWKDGTEDPRLNLLQLRPGAKVVGGLHVIGTERHTARRIDNQLRGRAGRQGDAGSSRFYVSLQDDLMKMFAGEWTIKVLGFLGLEEGMAIEDKRISRGILNAQKKVEERNYLSRKNMLEYDDVMDAQRTHFYGTRQQVLEGRDVAGVIWGMIDDAIADAVDKYITQDYVAASVAEWAAGTFQVQIDPRDLRGRRDLHQLEQYVKAQARNEVETNLPTTIGEFTGEDETDTKSWDTRGLSSWAMSRFGVNLSQAQIRRSTPRDLEDQLRAAAVDQIDRRDVSGLSKYVEKLFPERELAAWARDKFGIELTAEEIADTAGKTRTNPADAVTTLIEGRAREAYAAREIEYPVHYVLTIAFTGPTGDLVEPAAAPPERSQIIAGWVRSRYGVDWSLDHIRERTVRQLHDEMCNLHEELIRGGKLKADLDAINAAGTTREAQLAAFNARFGLNFPDLIFTPEKLPPAMRAIVGEPTKTTPTNAAGDAAAPADPRAIFANVATALMRKELTELEQYVLIEIFDLAWMEHLYAMDMLKSGIGLQSFAEQDPRVLYKKEGFEYFRMMNAGIRDKVTDQIFRAKLMGSGDGQPRRRNYRVLATTHATDAGYGVSETVASGGDTATAERGNGEMVATKPITRDAPKVGRNDLCPCGSGKKYKKCHGASLA